MRYIRKIDDIGTDWVGKINGDDFTPFLRRFVQRSVPRSRMVKEKGVAVGMSRTSWGTTIASGSEVIIPWNEKDFVSTRDFIYQQSEQVYQVQRTGIYIFNIYWLTSFSNVAITKPSHIEIRLGVNNSTVRLLDRFPIKVTLIIGTGAEAYLPFGRLTGNTFYELKAGDAFDFRFYFESLAIPPQGLTTADLHSGYFNVTYTDWGTKWQQPT